MRLTLTSLHPDWMMKTSSSRTDSVILTSTSPLEKFLTVVDTRGTPSLGEMNFRAHTKGVSLTAQPQIGRARGDCCLQGDEAR